MDIESMEKFVTDLHETVKEQGKSLNEAWRAIDLLNHTSKTIKENMDKINVNVINVSKKIDLLETTLAAQKVAQDTKKNLIKPWLTPLINRLIIAFFALVVLSFEGWNLYNINSPKQNALINKLIAQNNQLIETVDKLRRK